MASDIVSEKNDEGDLVLTWSGRWTLAHRILAVNALTLVLVGLAIIYLDSYRNRLEKERENILKQIASIESKLSNKSFVDRAPAEVVQQQRDKLAELRGQLASVEAALKKLG